METKNYIVELQHVQGEDTIIYLEADNEPVRHLFAIVAIAERGACIVDNCYRSIGEAQKAWPDAVVPKPHHLTSTEHHTVEGSRS